MLNQLKTKARLLKSAAAISLITAACGVAGAGSDAGSTGSLAAPGDQASIGLTGTLPIADLAERAFFDEAEHRTSETAIQQCMQLAGFDYEIAPYYPVDLIQIARRYGPIDESPIVSSHEHEGDETGMNPALAALDEAGRDAWYAAFAGDEVVRIEIGEGWIERAAGGCLEAGWAAAVGDVDLWLETTELIQLVLRDSSIAAEADPRVQQALAQWSSCMRSSGYPTIATREDLESVQGNDLEIVDARCNNAVGLATTWLMVETEIQLTILAERGPMLESMLAGTSLGR